VVKNWNAFDDMLQYLEDGEIIGVGDASVENKVAVHSYDVLETKDEKFAVQGNGPVDTDVDDITSNRAEGCTVIAILTLAVALTRFLELEHPKIIIVCDNVDGAQVTLLPFGVPSIHM